MRDLAPAESAASPLVSVVIPCLNEAENIVQCVTRALEVLEESEIAGEVIVADNGSTDGSAELAEAAGATVVDEPRRGYGRAYLAGFAAARGDYIVMVDADLTYDFNEIPRFVKELDEGAQLVMGNRMQNIQPGAMPWMNRYIGNPLLSGFLKLLFRTKVRDARSPAGRAPEARAAHGRHGVRVRDGDPCGKGGSRCARVPDRAPSARRRVEAQSVQRRLAPPAPDAAVQPDLPLSAARHAGCARRGGHHVGRVRARLTVRAHLPRPHAACRLATRSRRHATTRLRSLRTDLCRPPPRGPRSLARATHLPVPPRARPLARRESDRSGGRARRLDRRDVDRSRTREPRGGA